LTSFAARFLLSAAASFSQEVPVARFTNRTLAVIMLVAASSAFDGVGWRSSVGPRLRAVVPMPDMGDQTCLLGSTGLGAVLYAADDDHDARHQRIDRPPARTIRDTYATYSAIAVDLGSDEVILQDENLFGVKAFDRLTNTPPRAAMSEPKRQIAGTATTKLEFNCGLYIDQQNGDLYSVANDTVDTLVVFDRHAEGDVPPKRELVIPHRSYGIAVDEQANEMFLTSQHPSRIVVWRKQAQGNEKPLRIIEGPQTLLEDAHGIGLDTKNGWIFVANHGSTADPKVDGSGRNNPPSISVHPLKGSGNVPPLRVIQGPKTQLNWPAHVAVDERRGEVFVANDSGQSILVFRETDSGDVAPTRVIRGPATQLRNPTGLFLDTAHDEIWVANMGNHRATVYDRDANGNVPPKRVIRSAPEEKLAQIIGNPGAVGYDSKRDEILVPN
jgi:6-phosphogluconolactonase (cycloisomerase 2 family)